jgi:hypothetical protein
MDSIFARRKWAENLACDLWAPDIAVKLTVCGPLDCIDNCSTHFGYVYAADKCEGKQEIVQKIYSMLYDANGLGCVIPQDYIQWALSNDIKLPQEMLDWYNVQQAKSAEKSLSGQGSHAANVGQEEGVAPPLPTCIEVTRELPRIKGKKGTYEQRLQCLADNSDALNTIKMLKNSGYTNADIVPLMQGGKKVIACLLYPDKTSPEAAYRQSRKDFPTK